MFNWSISINPKKYPKAKPQPSKDRIRPQLAALISIGEKKSNRQSQF
jgi:hypothetical protein